MLQDQIGVEAGPSTWATPQQQYDRLDSRESSVAEDLREREVGGYQGYTLTRPTL
jgi:hypothetical protein